MAYMSEVANLLLCTPFDNKSAVKKDLASELSVEVFMSKCFSEPQFMREIKWKKENENKDNSEYKIKLEDLQYNIYKQKRENDNFDIWLNNFYNFKVYVLNGHAGTGKTTYINYLKYKNCNEKKWIILDFSSTNNSITWFGDERLIIASEKFVSAYRKAYASILATIRDILFGYYDDKELQSVDKILDGLYRLDNCFCHRYAYKYPAGRVFMQEFHNILGTETDVSQAEKVIQVAKYCKTYFMSLEENSTQDEIIQKGLDILLLLLKCSDDESMHFIITFDNIERFISKEEIYNQDVVNLRKNIISYSVSINEKGGIHRGYFKFLIVVRNSTESMSDPKLQSLDELSARIDISDWFDIDDIILRKIEWLKSKNMENGDLLLVEQIIGDIRVCTDKTVTGLKLFIDPLLNNNTRLSIDFIGLIVESMKNCESIKNYCQFWNEQTQLSKFAARSIMRGLILYQLKKSDNLFMHLRTYSDNPNVPGLGISRRILTILFNHMQNTKIEYISFDKLMRDLFCVNDIKKMWKELKEKNKKDITEILFYMNSYSRRDNDWIQFIDLQYTNSEKNVVIENKYQLYEMISDDLQNFSVKIMPGGIAYLKYIVASYEYFSMRYHKDGDYRPLFELIPTENEIKSCRNIKDLPCIQNILFVNSKARECIRILGDEDPTFKLYIEGGRGYSHKERIIKQHVEYLNLFMSFIEEKYCKNNFAQNTNEKYNELLNYINSIRKSYFLEG